MRANIGCEEQERHHDQRLLVRRHQYQSILRAHMTVGASASRRWSRGGSIMTASSLSSTPCSTSSKLLRLGTHRPNNSCFRYVDLGSCSYKSRRGVEPWPCRRNRLKWYNHMPVATAVGISTRPKPCSIYLCFLLPRIWYLCSVYVPMRILALTRGQLKTFNAYSNRLKFAHTRQDLLIDH